MSLQSLVHLRTCYQVSPADCKVHLSECCHVLSGWTSCSLHGCLLCHVINPIASHFLFCCNSLKPLAGYSCWGYGRLCLFASLSMALSSTMCSDWSAVNISASPLGWSCDCVYVCVFVRICGCVCVWEWAAGCSLAQPAMPCWLSAHRALWAVNNVVPQPRAPDRARRGVKTPARKRKCLPQGLEILNQQTGEERGRWIWQTRPSRWEAWR